MKIEEYLLKNYTKSSFRPWLTGINKYLNFIGESSEKATHQDVLDYIGHLRTSENLHPKTLKQYLGAVKIYYNYLLYTGKREDHPCKHLNLKDKIDRSLHINELYSEEELEVYLEACNELEPPYQRRIKLITSLLVYQGLKVSEICGLKKEDLNLEKGEIHIETSESKRILTLKPQQIMLTHRYLEEDYPTLTKHLKSPKRLITGKLKEVVRPNVLNRMINEWREKADQIPPLKIRQSVIANLLRQGHDTRIVQVFSGHKRSSSTIKYKQDDLQQLRKAINLYHPVK